MKKGRIIFLNGVTSSGKTSIVESLQEQDEIFFYVVANDLFQEMVGDKYLRENYWKHLSEVIIMMYHTAKLYSDMGKNVLIDGILVERDEIKPHYRQLREILKNNPLDIVEIYCPLDICRQRNISRGDRYETQSDEQYELMAKNITYSLKVDTSIHSPEECANFIIEELFKNECASGSGNAEMITNLRLDTKQINNLCTGVKLAAELKSENANLRKFLTVQGYCYNDDGQAAGLKKVLKPEILDSIYFEVRCYELSVDYYTNRWDVTEDELASEVYLDDIKGIKALEAALSAYIRDYSLLRPEWECDNLL